MAKTICGHEQEQETHIQTKSKSLNMKMEFREHVVVNFRPQKKKQDNANAIVTIHWCAFFSFFPRKEIKLWQKYFYTCNFSTCNSFQFLVKIGFVL